MPIVNSCCFKFSNKAGSIVIGALLFVFTVAFLAVTIGLVAGWEDFDTDFLDDRINRLNSTTGEKIRQEYEELKAAFQKDIRPVWKKEFISLYCFLPWYALVNILLIIGAKKGIKVLVILWILFTLGFLVWSFVLISIMFSFDTTPAFVIGLALAQLFEFCLFASFIIVVFSFYQELVGQTVKEVNVGREDNYIHRQQDSPDAADEGDGAAEASEEA